MGQPSGDAEIVKLLPALRAFARTFHRDRDEADDLVQETLSKGLSNMHQFRPGTSMKSWLFTIIAQHVLHTASSAASERPPGLLIAFRPNPSTNPTQEWSARGKEIAAALERLPQEQREIVMLVGVLGQSYEEAERNLRLRHGYGEKPPQSGTPGRLLQELREDSVSGALTSSELHPSTSPLCPSRELILAEQAASVAAACATIPSASAAGGPDRWEAAATSGSRGAGSRKATSTPQHRPSRYCPGHVGNSIM